MNDELIVSFRNKINEGEWGLQIFREYDSKNMWSVICSAMDWIEVSISGIDIKLLSRNNTNDASIKMITFLSCIDIMWEAISQLHRVLFSTTGIPFANDSSVFGQEISDNEYFKQIRACFAAHQINLRGVYPDDMPEERWYASWSGGVFSNDDFSVILSSNVPNKESKSFDINFSELVRFAERRYQYLENLSSRFDEIVAEYKKGFIETPIELKQNLSERIELLIIENEKRFRNNYYQNELNNIKMVFAMDFSENERNNAIVDELKSALIFELNEIQNNLQNMIQSDLQSEVDYIFPEECRYAFAKLSDAVLGVGNVDTMFRGIVSTLNNYVSTVVYIDEDMPLEKIYVLFKAACYILSRQ